ncbi:TetR family transcriptional regulator [Microbacterium mangrovi]|uniref:TetR family transcriptional regulator n=1 Tax=Microbacterium mangrovi TaxID=1348253 RepID=A0A0B2AAS1_9MICO|nr:TetR family transcriptional regulator [Microbacterium mangrovi]KHK98701.1 TetR family transcriptional regulator [Microbacterium mangrovi]
MTEKQPTPTLTQRRKAETELIIARAAAGLFTANGAHATTAEAIAAASGIALRTFYRYFRTKEEAVAPLLTVGAEGWRALLAATPRGMSLEDAVADAIRRTLTAPPGDEGLALTRGLLLACGEDAALAAVWYRVNGESEARLLPILHELSPRTSAVDLHLMAAAATSAIRIAFELWAPSDDPAPPADLAVRCFRALSPSPASR